jgi:hypothetical protein
MTRFDWAAPVWPDAAGSTDDQGLVELVPPE